MSLIVPVKSIYHLYNQGNRKQKIFFDAMDYYYFLKLFRKYVHPYCDLFAWCLMPNHFHFMFLFKSPGDEIIKVGSLEMTRFANGMRLLQSHYAHYFNRKYLTSGNLFRQKAKIKSCAELQSDYRITLFNYIHFNPVTDGLVKNCGQWQFSSYNDYYHDRGGTLVSKELTAYYLGLEVDTNGF